MEKVKRNKYPERDIFLLKKLPKMNGAPSGAYKIMNKNTTKTKTQLAILLGKSESSISRWMKAGCPYTVVCDGTLRKRPMFNVDEVQAWLASQARRACYGKRKGVEQ